MRFGPEAILQLGDGTIEPCPYLSVTAVSKPCRPSRDTFAKNSAETVRWSSEKL